MLAFPKVKKGINRPLTRAEKVKKIIVGVALALGVALTGTPARDVQAAPMTQNVQQAGGAILFTAPAQAGDVVAQHYSHSSHASHASHRSHYSHYSSRY